jgi:mono/diheme cytochrome c family protein
MKTVAKRLLLGTRPRQKCIMGVAFSTAVVLGCGGSRQHATSDFSPESLAEQVESGKSLYEKHCVDCHGPEGRNGEAPPLTGKDSLPLQPSRDAGMRDSTFESARDVADFVVEEMPPGAARRLSVEEHYAVLAYLLSHSEVGPQRPLTPSSASDLLLHP